MANRLNAPNQFETLSPPWILSQLDTNATQNQTAWNDSSLGFMNGLPTDTGSANAYLITLPLGAPSSYRAGMCVSFIPANTNTGASTVTVSPLGSSAIINAAGTALQGGEIAANRKLDLIHDGTAFRIIGPCPITKNYGAIATNQTLDCAGAISVGVFASFTNNAGFQLTLQHLAAGVPVSVFIANGSGVLATFQVIATDPANSPYSHSYIVGAGGIGVFTDMQSAAVSLASGSTRIMTGMSVVAGVLMFT